MSGENILVQVPKPSTTRNIPVVFRLVKPTWKTIAWTEALIPEAVVESEFKDRKYLWLKGEKRRKRKEHSETVEIPLPEGALVYVKGGWGSRSKDYVKYWAIIIPREGVKCRITDDVEVENAEVVWNGSITPELEAEMLNRGYTASRNKLEDNYGALVVLKYVEDMERKEEETKELAMEFEEIHLQTPPQKTEEQKAELPELELEEVQLPTAPQPPSPTPRKPELVKVYFLGMRLPSKYLVQELQYEDRGGKEIRIFNTSDARKRLATALESIRRQAYRMVERVFCCVPEFGVWVAVTDEAVKEAQEISKYVIKQLELRKVDFERLGISFEEIKRRYYVKAIPVYLEPADAKTLLECAIAKLSADVKELERKIEEAEKEQNKRRLKELMSQKTVRQNLLESFKKFLEKLEREYGLVALPSTTAVTKKPEDDLKTFLREVLKLPENEAYRRLKDEVEVIDWWFTAFPDHRARIKIKGKEMELVVEYTPPYIPALEELGFSEEEVQKLSRVIHSVVLAKTPELLRKIKDDKYYLSVMKIMLPPDM